MTGSTSINILFYIFLAVFLIIHMGAFYTYRKYKKVKEFWDGEDEETADRIEEKISYVIWAEYIATALGFLYFALMLGTENFESLFSVERHRGFCSVYHQCRSDYTYQQKCVDLEKEMSPEKQGSVYDTKFNEKWLESCDEAERMMIYRSAWTSYRVMGTAYVIAWAVTFLAHEFFNTGLFACCVVIVLWMIQNSVYCYKSIHLSK